MLLESRSHFGSNLEAWAIFVDFGDLGVQGDFRQRRRHINGIVDHLTETNSGHMLTRSVREGKAQGVAEYSRRVH